ncbi:response regulator [Candidatus Saccharibacteria bacterium]|nr:response regulator [Candidatus Saccharibacteria bacterium]
MTKIMLVEDDKSLREIYSIRLAAEGYSIALAGDGEEALSVVVQEKPDLIIADVMMPKISGFDMLDILRSQPETKNIKVIMMTALSSDDQRQRSEALGAAKHLVKSQVGIEDVINAVHEVLGDAPNANAQANIDTAKAVSDLESKPATPVASTNSTVVEPASQDAPSAPEAPQGPIATPQNGDQSANFNQAPTTVPAAMYAQPVVGAVNNGMPAPQLVSLQTAPVMQSAPIMQQGAAQQITGMQPNVIPLQPGQVNLPQPNTVQSALAQNAVRLQMAGVNPSAEQVMQQANLQAIQSMYSQMTAQNSTLKPADRVLPNAQVAAIAAMQAAQQQNAAAVAPAPAPIQEEKKEKGASERVIQPLHDPFAEQQRDEMQKRMAAMLGEDADAEATPTTINTKTARNEKIEMKVPTAEQAAAAVPIDAAQIVQKAMPQTTADAAQSVQQAVAQGPVQQSTPQSEPSSQSPVQAALQAQATQAQANAAAATQAAPADQGEKQPDPTDLSKITVDTKIPSIDEIEDPGVDVTVKAAVPGYLSDLEDELSNDLADGVANDPNSMAARMSAELVGDEVTRAAQEKAEAEIAARKAEAEDLLKNPARQVKQTTVSPNIQSAAQPEEPEETAAPQTAAAPQAPIAPQAPAAAPQALVATPQAPVAPQAPAAAAAPAIPQPAQAAVAPQAPVTPQAPAAPQTATAPQAQQSAPQVIQTMGPQEMGALS